MESSFEYSYAALVSRQGIKKGLLERGRVVSATLPRRFLILGGNMDEKLHEVYNCLKIMDMLLYKHGYEPKTVAGFKSTEEMARYYREFLHVILPEKYHYSK